MTNENCRDKLVQCNIGVATKPFVDQNLQFQHPFWDDSHSKLRNSIHSHFSTYRPNSLPFNESEFYAAMNEARESYLAWKKLKDNLDKNTAS